MPTSSEISKMTDAVVQPIRILLAEADPTEIERIKSAIDPKFHNGIKIANNYHQLLESLAQKRPQLVILGKIDKSSYSEIASECHNLRRNLPIFLLSSQGIIIESFRQLVKSCGLTDVITRDFDSLDRLFQAAENHARELSKQKPIDKSLHVHLTRQPREQVRFTPTPPTSDPSQSEPIVSGQIALAGLQEIVTVSNNYFGPLAQGNYWRKAHARLVDEFPFIQNWAADHFSQLSCDEKILVAELTTEDIHILRLWVSYFLEECERIIVDFRAILNDSDLSPSALDLLTKS
jgi:hypothetical protein